MLKRYADILLAGLVLAWLTAGALTFYASPFYGFTSDFRTGMVRDVVAGSFLQPGDRLIRANGLSLEGLGDFRAALRARARGAPLQLEIERQGFAVHRTPTESGT